MKKEPIDTDKILKSVDIVDLVGRTVQLKRVGQEMVGLCPFHQDTKPSLKVNQKKQIFSCFACGVSGDAIEWLIQHGATFPEACRELQINSGDFNETPTKRKGKTKTFTPVEWKPVHTVSKYSGPIPDHYRWGKPSRVWTYHDHRGNKMGHICRFDLPDGKQVLPLVWASVDGERADWRWMGFEKPRPLYQLDKIYKAEPDTWIIVVEGEKTADALQKLVPQVVATCWIGGARGVKHADWSFLDGKNVMLWPDNDQPGFQAMDDVFNIIKGNAANVIGIKPPDDAPEKWDVADATTWTRDDAETHIESHQVPLPFNPSPDPVHDDHGLENAQEPIQEGPGLNGHDVMEQVVTGQGNDPLGSPDQQPGAHDPLQEHFLCLGYHKNENGAQVFNFFARSSHTTISMTAAGMTLPNLLQLGPLTWWKKQFPPSSARSEINLAQAIDTLVTRSNKIGTYNSKKIRGRGAWLDDGRVVIHNGNGLIVDGVNHTLGTIKTKYIYETGEPMDLEVKDPAQAVEAVKVVDMMKLLNWEREINAYLLAGWCVIAPVCGALKWRPHIWLTGAAGTGKTWVFTNLVRRLLGKTGLPVQAETTEAGLRQTLCHDALPVVFDEAEGGEGDRKTQERMSAVLGLMRAASADDGGVMAKGSSSGISRHYRIRSCFAFASIAIQVAQQSDRTRVTILGFKSIPATDPRKKERWEILQKMFNETVTDQWVERIQSRTIKLLPVIMRNAEVFSAATAAEIGDQRAGDQLGAMLAGAYSLFSTKEISYDDACAWIKQRDWSEEKGLKQTVDEMSLFEHIMNQMVNVETNCGTKVDRNVGELVRKVIENDPDSDIFNPDAPNEVLGSQKCHDRLKRLGIRVEDGHIVISNTADGIRRCLIGTAWARNHNKIIMRLPGAQAVDSVRFASGVTTRAVKVPIGMILPCD